MWRCKARSRKALAEHWGEIIGIAVSKGKSGEPELKLPNCSFRFVKGGSDIMSGLTFRVGDVAGVRDAARARGRAVSGDSFELGGVTLSSCGVSIELVTSLHPSLRGAQRRSNPHCRIERNGLLRCARNDGVNLRVLNKNKKGSSCMPHPLDSFFAPESIALIGASRDLEKIPGRLLSMLRKNEFPGKIYPINPNYGDIDGLKCYSSIADVGQPIDLAIVIIPARAVLGALEQCAAVGVKNAVIISSGFAEEGGDSAAMQDAIVALAKRTGMRISGPNAEGFYSQVQRVAATFSPTVDVKPGESPLVATTRRIGIVAQSGGIGFAIYHRAKALGIALSYVVSAGNESDLGAGEFLDYMVQDASTDVILLFIEGIRDVDKFLAAARRAAESRQARHRHQGRPLRRGRARRRLAYRQHGRLVGGL